MPGSSLWLVPPADSKLNNAIQRLITTQIPSLFPNATPPSFYPHITLTADTVLEDPADPQAWLEGLDLPSSADKLHVTLRQVDVGSVFFKKVTMACDKTRELMDLAALCRRQACRGVDEAGAHSWVREQYLPHCSLMYSDLAQDNVAQKRREIEEQVVQAMQSSPDCNRAQGGEIWLVPTYKPLEEWQPIARRSVLKMRWTSETEASPQGL